MNCKNCNLEANSNFCSNCGQPVNLKRINGNYIIDEVKQVLNFQKGIFYTVRELLLRPGENIRNFIAENRNRLVKPIVFIIVTSLIYSLINSFFHIEDGYVQQSGTENLAVGIIFKWIQDHYGYANIIMGVFIAFWTKLFFRKYGYNFFEVLILLCFIMGMGMLILAVFAFFQGVFNIELMQLAGILFIIYCSWAIGQFFDKKKISNYFKAFVSYLLGMTTFMIAALLLGLLIDFITKH